MVAARVMVRQRVKGVVRLRFLMKLVESQRALEQLTPSIDQRRDLQC